MQESVSSKKDWKETVPNMGPMADGITTADAWRISLLHEKRLGMVSRNMDMNDSRAESQASGAETEHILSPISHAGSVNVGEDAVSGEGRISWREVTGQVDTASAGCQASPQLIMLHPLHLTREVGFDEEPTVLKAKTKAGERETRMGETLLLHELRQQWQQKSKEQELESERTRKRRELKEERRQKDRQARQKERQRERQLESKREREKKEKEQEQEGEKERQHQRHLEVKREREQEREHEVEAERNVRNQAVLKIQQSWDEACHNVLHEEERIALQEMERDRRDKKQNMDQERDRATWLNFAQRLQQKAGLVAKVDGAQQVWDPQDLLAGRKCVAEALAALEESSAIRAREKEASTGRWNGRDGMYTVWRGGPNCVGERETRTLHTQTDDSPQDVESTQQYARTASCTLSNGTKNLESPSNKGAQPSTELKNALWQNGLSLQHVHHHHHYYSQPAVASPRFAMRDGSNGALRRIWNGADGGRVGAAAGTTSDDAVIDLGTYQGPRRIAARSLAAATPSQPTRRPNIILPSPPPLEPAVSLNVFSVCDSGNDADDGACSTGALDMPGLAEEREGPVFSNTKPRINTASSCKYSSESESRSSTLEQERRVFSKSVPLLCRLFGGASPRVTPRATPTKTREPTPNANTRAPLRPTRARAEPRILDTQVLSPCGKFVHSQLGQRAAPCASRHADKRNNERAAPALAGEDEGHEPSMRLRLLSTTAACAHRLSGLENDNKLGTDATLNSGPTNQGARKPIEAAMSEALAVAVEQVDSLCISLSVSAESVVAAELEAAAVDAQAREDSDFDLNHLTYRIIGENWLEGESSTSSQSHRVVSILEQVVEETSETEEDQQEPAFILGECDLYPFHNCRETDEDGTSFICC